MTEPRPVTVDVRLGPQDMADTLRREVRDGLTSELRELPPKWFYDDRGCELFEQITRLPEYYPTETERSILCEHAADIVAASGADTLVELGSGSSDKTRTLLDAFAAAARLRSFVPFEVNEATVRDAAEAIATEYPGTEVHAVVGDFEHHLGAIPRSGRRLVAFLGSTIGNFPPAQRKEFLASLAATMSPGDSLLLGTDLVKDVARLEAAYADRRGVTAEFNLNVLAVVNRELAADFDLARFEHRSFFDVDEERIEMRLRSTADQVVTVGELGLELEFAEGDEIRTELSHKFRRQGVADELAGAGLELAGWWTDPAEDFALSLAVAR